MVWPLPSLRPSRAIETPPAAPVTTTWKDSNSFFAAAMRAEVAAPAGACTEGRIFWAAGAIQTWAAEADPAATSVAIKGSVFIAVPPWLAASRNDRCSTFRVPNGGGLPLLPRLVCCGVRRFGRLSGQRGVAPTAAHHGAERNHFSHTGRKGAYPY